MSRTLTILVVGLCTRIATAASPPVQITSCGQSVPPRAHGVVANDLSCPASDPFVVEVQDRGTLDVAGHTLAGGGDVVRCSGKCIVTSSAGHGTLRDSDNGLRALGKVVKPSNLDFVNDGVGILADFNTTNVRGSQLTITGGFGISAKRVRVDGLTVTGAFPAIQSQYVALSASSVTGCGGSAIRGGRVRLVGSTMSGNTPVDLETLYPPHLINSTCELSRDLASGNPWGVCTND